MKFLLRFPIGKENSSNTRIISMDWLNTKIAVKFIDDRNTGTTSTTSFLTLYNFYKQRSTTLESLFICLLTIPGTYFPC